MCFPVLTFRSSRNIANNTRGRGATFCGNAVKGAGTRAGTLPFQALMKAVRTLSPSEVPQKAAPVYSEVQQM